MEAHRLTCNNCNNVLGNRIDQVLFDQFRDIAAITGCIRGDGDPVGPVTVPEWGSGNRLRVEAGAREVRCLPEVTLSYPDGVAGQAKKTFESLDYRAIAGFSASQLMSRAPDEGTLTISATINITSGSTGQLVGRPFGETPQFRSVGKMGLAAVVHRRGLRRGQALDVFGRWIATGEGEHVYALDADAGLKLRTALGTKVGVHILAILPLGDGHWEAVFVAFGTIPYRIRIPSPLDGLTQFAHIVDPVAHSHSIRDLPSINLRPLADVVAQPGDGQGPIAELNAWVDEKAAEAHAKAPATSRTVDLDILAREIMATVSRPRRR